MRWFTDAAYTYENEADWNTMLDSYYAHLQKIEAGLPRSLAALALEPRLNLHDAAIRSIDVDDAAHTVTMRVVAGDLQVGYRDLILVFRGATLAPDNLQLLAFALGARYQTDHWGEVTTIIRAQEVDVDPEGGFILRLRLWPFHEFAINFTAFELEESPTTPPGSITGELQHRRPG